MHTLQLGKQRHRAAPDHREWIPTGKEGGRQHHFLQSGLQEFSLAPRIRPLILANHPILLHKEGVRSESGLVLGTALIPPENTLLHEFLSFPTKSTKHLMAQVLHLTRIKEMSFQIYSRSYSEMDQ